MSDESGRLVARLRQLAASGALDLPRPGRGSTCERFRALAAFGEEDVGLGRLAEAHCDAVAILGEASRTADQRSLYGVWAAEVGPDPLVARRLDGGWHLDGVKRYCSGASLLDAALVTARVDGSDLVGLFDLPLGGKGLTVDTTAWAAPALAATATGTVVVRDVLLPDRALVGRPGWYLDRPGFWQGSVGVAACWAGSARPLAGTVSAATSERDPHAMAHLGGMLATLWAMDAVVDRAADEIDADPTDAMGDGRGRAMIVRHIVEQGCREVIDRSARAAGPGPLAFDDAHQRRVADLSLYIRQHHGERDAEEISRQRRRP